jgi:hypothetical protein
VGALALPVDGAQLRARLAATPAEAAAVQAARLAAAGLPGAPPGAALPRGAVLVAFRVLHDNRCAPPPPPLPQQQQQQQPPPPPQQQQQQQQQQPQLPAADPRSPPPPPARAAVALSTLLQTPRPLSRRVLGAHAEAAAAGAERQLCGEDALRCALGSGGVRAVYAAYIVMLA